MMKKAIATFALVCAVAVVLPVAASAEVWHLEPEDGTTGQSITISGGTTQWRTAAGTVTHCTSITGSGKYVTNTTGEELTLTLHGCTMVVLGFTVNCQSGATAGTITTTDLDFHNILIDKGTPGVLITPNTATKVFSHYTCGGVAVTNEGNGVIGDFTKACGSTGVTSGVLDFDSTVVGGSIQKYMQITTTGEKYDLKRNNGETMALVAEMTITNSKKSKVNCT